MIYASFDLCQFSLVSEENSKDLTSSSQLKKSMVKEWGRGTPLFSQADSILTSALNVFISSLPQISYQRDRSIQMCWSSNVTGRNTKQMGYFCKRELIPDEKIRLQGTLCFTLSPTLTLIDALSDNRIVESQVFLPLSLFFIKVQVISLIILCYTGFSSLVVFKSIYFEVLWFGYSVDLFSFPFLSTGPAHSIWRLVFFFSCVNFPTFFFRTAFFCYSLSPILGMCWSLSVYPLCFWIALLYTVCMYTCVCMCTHTPEQVIL